MKKIEILKLNQILSRIKLNKLDKEVRETVLKNHLLTFKLVKDFSEVVEEMRKKLTEGYEEEISLLEKYRNDYMSASKDVQLEIIEKIKKECSKALTAEQEFHKFYNKILNENVDVDINKMNKNTFLDCCALSDVDITVSDIIDLECLFEE